MGTNVMEQLERKAKAQPKRVALPEADEEKILLAARHVRDRGIGYPTLIGDAEAIKGLAQRIALPLDDIELLNSIDGPEVDRVITSYSKFKQDLPAGVLKRMARDPMNLALMMLVIGEVDGVVAGLSHTTGDVIVNSQLLVGLKDGISTVSSMGLTPIKGFEGPDGKVLALADFAVNPAPDADQLADIAIATADTSRALVGWEPRVALLSFSTKGSAVHERIDIVIEALKLVRKRRPDMIIDGELQVDSAIVPAVAAKKVKGSSPVAGKANVLIFPDLNAGNISMKFLTLFATDGPGAGPLLQGFARPVCDLSRGVDVEGIVGAIISVVVLAQA